MVNRNKQIGTDWESAVRDFLNVALVLVDDEGNWIDWRSPWNVRRAAQEGSRDVGDVHCIPFVLECKNVKTITVPAFIRQAEREARHAGYPYGVAVVKTRKANVRRGLVHFGIRTFTRVRLVLGLTSRQAHERYGFTLSLRGRDTSCWYLTTDLERFAVLVADVRAAIPRLDAE